MAEEQLARIILSVTFTSSGAMVLGLGYLIRVKQQVSLISGVDRKKVRDLPGLTRFIGRIMEGLGVASLLVVPLIWLFPQAMLGIVLGYSALSLLAILPMVFGTKQFMEP